MRGRLISETLLFSAKYLSCKIPNLNLNLRGEKREGHVDNQQIDRKQKNKKEMKKNKIIVKIQAP